MGVDETYPLHRYFSWVTDLTHALGGPALTADAVRIEDPAAKNLELTEEQRALKAELRDYFTGLADARRAPRLMATDRHGPTYQKTIRQMGDDGWMGVGWPKEYGGHGLGEVEQTIFANEAQRADVHLPAVTLQTVGPTLIRYGTEQQKDLFLKRILAGDVHFAIGYSEPDAGTDLASLRTTADARDGDHYVVNGQKMWTTGGHQADYLWLACRTDPDAPKHQGISILIVDTSDPGYSWTPIITADGAHHVNATYFNDVRVPVDMLVGEENQGWKLITTQLNHERVMLGPAGRIEGLRDRVAAWADRRAASLDEPDVRRTLARGDRGLPGQRAAQLAGRPRRRGRARSPSPTRRRRRCSPPTGCSASAGCWPRSCTGTATWPTRDTGDLLRLPRQAGQAEPRAHLRRRRQRGAAGADRDVRARPAAGAAMSEP